jgi:hypothetical protein
MRIAKNTNCSLVTDTAIHVAQELGCSYMQGAVKTKDAYIHKLQMLNGADCGG